MGAALRVVSALALTVLTAFPALAHSSPPGPEESYSGLIKVNHTRDAHYFHWTFPSRKSPAEKTILWLSGGPGCSSEIALFYELGPYKFGESADDDFKTNEYSWNSNGNLIFVDQPTGAGYSYSSDSKDYATSEETVADDLYTFLLELFQQHPELGDPPLYIFGESYAGHYVPAISHRIARENKGVEDKKDWTLKLEGVAIGNGLVEPRSQYAAYADYAFENNLIGAATKKAMEAAFTSACDPAIRLCESTNSNLPPSAREAACASALDVCEASCFSPVQAEAPFHTGHKFNPYDITDGCQVPPLCYDFTSLEQWANRQSTREALGVGNSMWDECSTYAYAALTGDWMQNLATSMPETIESGVKVLVYAGELDFICNWLGNERWVESLPWPGREEYLNREWKQWRSNLAGRVAGEAKEAGGLAFVKVKDAGHMVPMDQPAAALDLVETFTAGKSFEASETLPTKVSRREERSDSLGSSLGTHL